MKQTYVVPISVALALCAGLVWASRSLEPSEAADGKTARESADRAPVFNDFQLSVASEPMMRVAVGELRPITAQDSVAVDQETVLEEGERRVQVELLGGYHSRWLHSAWSLERVGANEPRAKVKLFAKIEKGVAVERLHFKARPGAHLISHAVTGELHSIVVEEDGPNELTIERPSLAQLDVFVVDETEAECSSGTRIRVRRLEAPAEINALGSKIASGTQFKMCPGRYAIDVLSNEDVLASRTIDLGPEGSAIALDVPTLRTGRVVVRFRDSNGNPRPIPAADIESAMEAYALSVGAERVSWSCAQWGGGIVDPADAKHSALILTHAAPADIALSLVID